MNPKQQLQKLIEDIKTKKFRESEAKGLMSQIQEEQTRALQPVLEKMAESIGEMAKNAIQEAIKDIKVEIPPIEIPPVDVRIPDIQIPEIRVPEARVNVPAPIVNVPQTKFPEFPKFPDRMKVDMDSVSNKTPLPVMLIDTQGRPFQFPVAGGSSGKADFLTIKGFTQSAFAELTNPDGRVKVELPTGSSGLTDTELRASAVPVAQVSGSNWSTNVVDAFGSTTVGGVFNADNRVRVSVETGGSGLTDSELRATAVPVSQVSGANWSVSVTDVFGSTGTNIVNSDGRLKVELPTGSSGLTDTELRASAVPVSQVSGSAWSTEVTNTVTVSGSLTSTGAYLLDGDGNYRGTLPVEATNLDIRDLDFSTDDVSVYQVSGHRWSTEATQSGTWNIETVTTITGITNTIATANVDSTGAQYSGSNPMPTYLVAGSGNSTVSVGDLASDAADTGSAPVKIGGIARTANPTAVAAGDRVSATYDDLGRQVMRTLQVRDLIQTAYVSVTNGTETTLRAGVAGAFLDCIAVMCSNNSDAAVSLDIRPVTAGNIVHTIRIPANGTAGWAPPIPWPQSDTGNNWTVDGPDETGRTITVSALFSQEL